MSADKTSASVWRPLRPVGSNCVAKHDEISGQGAGAVKIRVSRQTVLIRPSVQCSEIFGKLSKKSEYGISLLLFNFISRYCEMKINSRRGIPYLLSPVQYLLCICSLCKIQ